ncbi:uncharacterized protein LOC109824323 isoform X3 [Asparagus officinalis]|uniref:uncharacterized protein LOC109824323 isoform X3 n=3 Tax=Asparagus officinalis TaxID=4686 RepID=UPI00098DE9A0|nr:uncharacterized protein LOC109824323 isoform X3 [Asparagus officinalis]
MPFFSSVFSIKLSHHLSSLPLSSALLSLSLSLSLCALVASVMGTAGGGPVMDPHGDRAAVVSEGSRSSIAFETNEGMSFQSLFDGLDKREADDPCQYLPAIRTPGETGQSVETRTACCNVRTLSDRNACFTCNSIQEAQAQTVKGTLLVFQDFGY